MAEILQGTTPSLEIKISTSDFLVSDVVSLEFTVKHNGTTSVYGLSHMTADTENNSFIYNSSYSLTIDGTYKVEAYVLETPDGTSPFA